MKNGKNEIHITTKGNTVHAVLKDGDKVVKRSKAVCSPDDKFDFKTGAILAMDRLFVKEEIPKYVEIIGNGNNICHYFKVGDVCKVVHDYGSSCDLEELKTKYRCCVSKNDFKTLKAVKRSANVGDYIMLVDGGRFGFYPFDNIYDVFKIDKKEYLACATRTEEGFLHSYSEDEYVVLEGYEPKENIVPRLENEFGNYGIIGEYTRLKDTTGKLLFVGDVVLVVYNETGKSVESIVVDREGDQFVMGYRGLGTNILELGYSIFKRKSYESLTESDEVYGIRMVKPNEK